jgi:NitT/TauT family transport system ATP-binding protein
MNTAPPASLLTIRGLGKRFDVAGRPGEARWVIQDMSFEVRDGEFLTIVGPSGSGKTTLLNMIAQTDFPSAGEVLLRGEKILDAAAPRLRPGWNCQIGYVTQEDNLLPWRSAIDNVLYPLRTQGRLDEAGRARAQELMAAAGLAGFERYYPHELSGGMRKRVSLVRTLVYDPPVILMDEPFGALDAETKALLQADLMKLWAMRRKTIVFVTHDITEAIALGDRTLVVSRAPAHVLLEQTNDLPRPRTGEDVLVHPSFPGLYERIRKAIR